MDPNSNKKSTALVKKRSSELALMPPPPLPKRIKRPAIVLDEETYLDGLSQIIARDYFPGLIQNGAKQEFLNALDSKDDVWIRDAGSRLKQAMNGKTPGRRGVSFPDQTPREFVGDTPSAASAIQETPTPNVNLNMSLGAFQAKYTSEDNESFNVLLDKQNIKNRERQAYLWTGNKIPSARQIAYKEHEVKLLEESKTTDALTLASHDLRPAMPKYTKSDPRNALMFMPDSIEDERETVAQVAATKSNAPPKTIVHSNTRLEEPKLPKATVPPSPSLSAINDALAGRPRLSESSAGWETPKVYGYAFVDAEPTPQEVRAFEGGTSDSDAILKSITKDAESSPNPFNIKDSGDREKLHHKLVDKQKGKKGHLSDLIISSTPGRTPTPKFKSAPPKGSLTPAARMLFDRIKGTHATSQRRPSTPITNFDLTPTPRRSNRSNLLPGLTPKHNVLRRND